MAEIEAVNTKKIKEGRVIRLSKELEAFLRIRGKRGESYDAILRRHFGLPQISRKGKKVIRKPQPLREYHVLHNEGQPVIFMYESEARGAAIMFAVRAGRKKTEAVTRVREVPLER